MATPNMYELDLMSNGITQLFNDSMSEFKFIQNAEDSSIPEHVVNYIEKAQRLLLVMSSVLVKLGRNGALYLERTRVEASGRHVYYNLMYQRPSKILEHVVSVTGAGDTLVGSVVSGMLASENSKITRQILETSMQNASRSLMSPNAIADKN